MYYRYRQGHMMSSRQIVGLRILPFDELVSTSAFISKVYGSQRATLLDRK
jgi:hypothetical protein